MCRDLPLQHQAVQATHAGLVAGRDLKVNDDPFLVVLTVPTKSELIELSTQLTKHGVGHKVFHEADMDGRPTALGTAGLAKDDPRRRLFRKCKLYRATVAA